MRTGPESVAASAQSATKDPGNHRVPKRGPVAGFASGLGRSFGSGAGGGGADGTGRDGTMPEIAVRHVVSASSADPVRGRGEVGGGRGHSRGAWGWEGPFLHAEGVWVRPFQGVLGEAILGGGGNLEGTIQGCCRGV